MCYLEEELYSQTHDGRTLMEYLNYLCKLATRVTIKNYAMVDVVAMEQLDKPLLMGP